MPGIFERGGSLQHDVIGLHVLRPELAIVQIAYVEFPALFGFVQTLLQPLRLVVMALWYQLKA